MLDALILCELCNLNLQSDTLDEGSAQRLCVSDASIGPCWSYRHDGQHDSRLEYGHEGRLALGKRADPM